MHVITFIELYSKRSQLKKWKKQGESKEGACMACVRGSIAFLFLFFKSAVVRPSMTPRSFCHIWPELQGEGVPWRETGCSIALRLPHTSETPAEGKAQRVREEPPYASGLFWDSHCQLLWSRGGYLCCLQQFKASFFPALQSLACFSPTHGFYLVLATFEDWRWVDLGSDPTNWQSWPQGMNKILTGSNITVTAVQWALFCVLGSPEQFPRINNWAAVGSVLPPSLPVVLFSIRMETTFHTCFKMQFCCALHI